MVVTANSFPRYWEEPIWQLPTACLMAAFSKSQQISQPYAQPRAGDRLALLLRLSAAAWPRSQPSIRMALSHGKGVHLDSKKRWKAPLGALGKENPHLRSEQQNPHNTFSVNILEVSHPTFSPLDFVWSTFNNCSVFSDMQRAHSSYHKSQPFFLKPFLKLLLCKIQT